MKTYISSFYVALMILTGVSASNASTYFISPSVYTAPAVTSEILDNLRSSAEKQMVFNLTTKGLKVRKSGVKVVSDEIKMVPESRSGCAKIDPDTFTKPAQLHSSDSSQFYEVTHFTFTTTSGKVLKTNVQFNISLLVETRMDKGTAESLKISMSWAGAKDGGSGIDLINDPLNSRDAKSVYSDVLNYYSSEYVGNRAYDQSGAWNIGTTDKGMEALVGFFSPQSLNCQQ
jgi:hypothetical protein